MCDRPGTRGEDFDCQSHPPRTTAEGIDSDIAAAVAYVRDRKSTDLRVVTVGFCYAGSHSWRQSGGTLDLARCAGFYGKPEKAGGRGAAGTPADGDADPRRRLGDAVEEQLRPAETMRAAGAEVDAVVHDGAPHSYSDRSFPRVG